MKDNSGNVTRYGFKIAQSKWNFIRPLKTGRIMVWGCPFGCSVRHTHDNDSFRSFSH
jgi:hypothetical protein